MPSLGRCPDLRNPDLGGPTVYVCIIPLRFLIRSQLHFYNSFYF